MGGVKLCEVTVMIEEDIPEEIKELDKHPHFLTLMNKIRKEDNVHEQAIIDAQEDLAESIKNHDDDHVWKSWDDIKNLPF